LNPDSERIQRLIVVQVLLVSTQDPLHANQEGFLVLDASLSLTPYQNLNHMKYQCEITIDLPRSRVVELMDNPDNLSKWQPGLISFETIEGDPGAAGSRSRILYKMGKREVEMIETIVRRDLPDHFDAEYEAKGTYNLMRNHFTEISENQTLWVADVEFRFESLGMRLFGALMPGAFRKQSLKYMKHFKEFAEGD
jgi:hypothetical protein